jgi:glutaredoxin
VKITQATLLAASLWAGFCGAANAQTLYKSVGPDGTVVYSDRPPTSGTMEKTMEVRDLPNTAIPSKTLLELERLRNAAKSAPAQAQSQMPAYSTGVLLFSASWCGYCRQAKAYLAQRGVAYREFDIDTPDGRIAFVRFGGGGGVPLLISNGKKLRGYSRSGYEAVLAQR